MTHIFGFERSQLLLSPEAIDDYVDSAIALIAAPITSSEHLCRREPRRIVLSPSEYEMCRENN